MSNHGRLVALMIDARHYFEI